MQLFSGTIGAIIGALVAAAAAVFVLNRTNAKQQQLWDASNDAQSQRDRELREAQARAEAEARHLQAQRDSAAQEAQRQALEKQLAAQQDSLEKQMAAQAEALEAMHARQLEQAAKERQLQAAADLADSVLKLRLAVNSSESEVLACTTASTHAFAKWSIDLYGEHETFRSVLSDWLSLLAEDARALRNLRDNSHGSEDLQRAYNRLMSTYEDRVGLFIDGFSRWLAEPSRRTDFFDLLSTRMDSIAEHIHKKLGIYMPWYTGENK